MERLCHVVCELSCVTCSIYANLAGVRGLLSGFQRQHEAVQLQAMDHHLHLPTFRHPSVKTLTEVTSQRLAPSLTESDTVLNYVFRRSLIFYTAFHNYTCSGHLIDTGDGYMSNKAYKTCRMLWLQCSPLFRCANMSDAFEANTLNGFLEAADCFHFASPKPPFSA